MLTQRAAPSWAAVLCEAQFGSADARALRLVAAAVGAQAQGIACRLHTRLGQLDLPANTKLSLASFERHLLPWLQRVLGGPWDELHYRRTRRLTRLQARAGVVPRHLLAAMAWLRCALEDVVLDACGLEGSGMAATLRALHRVLDAELTIMLATVSELAQGAPQRPATVATSLAGQGDEVVEYAAALVATFAPNGRLSLFNRHCAALTGRDRTSVLGQLWVDICIAPEERPQARALLQQVLAGAPVSPLEASLPSISGPPGYLRRVRWYLSALPSRSGMQLCALGFDITEKHHATARARRAERLSIMGAMAAGIAHEIRNPLNSAHLQLVLVQRRLGRRQGADIAGALRAAQSVAGEIQRLARLVDEFLQFARPRPLSLATVDLAVIATEVVSSLQPQAERATQTIVLQAGARVVAQVDAERFKQVVVNLLRNALEAMPEGGAVALNLAQADDEIYMTVTDSGPGIDRKAPIFEPFFTTKEGGTGLGLTVVQRIVHDHSGQLGFISRPGETIFTVRLPRNISAIG